MRIIHFYSENFKRLKVVDFQPDQNMVIISGKNGQGKSSILDAIWSTFKHAAAKKKIPEPVRHGTGQAKNVLILDDYTVTRTFKGDKSTLKIETRDGSVVKSPQALLDKIVGELSFDPLTFANAKDADRRQMIQDVFGLDLAEFEAKDHQLREERSDKNRELKMIDGRLRAIKPPTGNEPTAEVSASDLIQNMTEISGDADKFKKNSRELNEVRAKIRELQAREQEIEREQYVTAAKYGQGNLTLDLECKWAEGKVAELREQIGDIETINARAREIQEYERQRELHDAAKAEVDRLKAAIELNKIERDEAIENADIPIDGISITEEGVLMNSVPFDQISQAEKIRASLAIAMAANPELRVLRIVDGSLLDSDNMELVREMAEEHDMQVWIECVDETGEVGIVIEDGEVIAEN